MNRVFTTVAFAVFAAACSAPQIDFCGKSCLGAGADCGPGYSCDATTKTCQANDNSCPSVTGGITGGGTGITGGSGGTGGRDGGTSGGTSGAPQIGTPCTPPTGTATDPCLADNAGLACNPNSTFTANSCTLPEEFETCVTGVGCDPETPPLICQDIQFTDGTSAFECLNDCTVTTDCPDPDDTCQSGICYSDFCGPGSTDGGFYAPCDSNATNDGTCLPYAYDGSDYGLCEANGTLAAGQTGCGNRPQGGGTNTLCVSDTVCIFSDQTGNSFCSPLCASTTPPAGPSCSSTTTCESDGVFGDCETTCTTSAVCPTGLTCQGGSDGTCLP
jgi:hypothetical protein